MSLKGWRTIIGNVVILAVSLLSLWGVDVDADTQSKIIAGVFAIFNVFMRTQTDTPVGKPQPDPVVLSKPVEPSPSPPAD